MLARRATLSLAALGILAAFAASRDAGDSPDQTKKRITKSECTRLVVRLINPDKPPFDKAYVLRLPKGVDERTLREKQAKIWAAYDALSDNIEVSLPILAKNLKDKHFSFVYTSTSGALVKETVGDACYDIIEAHVEVYRQHVTRGDDTGVPRCPSFIHDECGGMEKWWKSRQAKPLADLQLESIQWVLRQKKPKHFESEEEWTMTKRLLEKMTKGIHAAKKPILVGHHHPPLVVYK